MATPKDDEFRTIGLPRGAMQEILKGTDPSKIKAPDRAPFESRGLQADESPVGRVPSRSSERPDGRSSERDPARGPQPERARPLQDPDPQDYATVPPAGRRHPERKVPSPPNLRPAEDQRPRHPIGPEAVKARPAAPAARGHGATQDPRRDAVQSPAAGRPLDGPDFSTAQLPGSPARPGRAPVRELQGKTGPDIGVPFPDETCAAPPRTPVSAPFSAPEEPVSNETPIEFPGSDPEVQPYAPAHRPVQTPRSRDRLDAQNGIEGTVGWVPPRSAVSGTRSILQFFHNTIGRWSDLGEVGREGKVLSRYTFQAWDANPEGLAEEHLRIEFEGNELYVEPFETLNGVYRKLQPNRHEELPPHTRFRIGRHVLEFRPPDPPAEIAPRRSSDGEVFQSRVLVPLGFLDLIGPDGRSYLSFPLTKRGDSATRIGRAGVECDIALSGDEWVSLRHARIWWKDGKCWLEDLESTNGTFLILSGRTPIRRGTARYPATADEFLVGGYKIRVIEEKV